MKLRSLLFACLVWCGTANADDAGRELAQRSVCLACHQVDTKRVGPSFRDIALRYAGMEAAVQHLSRSIREGSRGLWGAIPMPAQRHVDAATAVELAEWILTLAPEAPGVQEKPEAPEAREAPEAPEEGESTLAPEGAVSVH